MAASSAIAALSAIAAYDVSDAESDDENKKQTEKSSKNKLNSDKDSPSKDNASVDSDNQNKVEDSNDASEEDVVINDQTDDDNDGDSEKDDEDDSMIISEDEKEESSDIPKDNQPVKLKFKRYSCDSATALAVKLKGMSQDELHLPPDPEGRCSKQLQDKMKRLYEKKIKEGENLNKAIQSRKDFRNPSIYDKLILFLRIEERGTNFVKADFDPSSWRKVPDYEDLARAQREDVAKRDRERKTKVEFVTGTVKKPSSSTTGAEPAKKSKWDNPGDDKTHSSASSNPTTKPTVISAVGPVKKTKA